MADISGDGSFDWSSLIGPALGAYTAYSSNGSSPGGTNTQNNQVPPQLQQLLGQVGGMAGGLGNMPFQGLPFDPVAGFAPQQYQGFDMASQYAQQPNALLSGAQDGLQHQFNNSNPYLSSDYTNGLQQQAMDQVQGRMGAMGMGSGSFGNANIATQTAQGLSQANQQIGEQARQFNAQGWGQDQNRQMQAYGMAPNIYQSGYMPSQAMQGIGQQYQQYGQNELNAAQQEFMRAQQYPYQQLNAAESPFGKNVGSFNTGTSTLPGTNPLSAMLGGALMGGQLQGMFGGQQQPQQNTQTANSVNGWGTL